MLSSQGVCTFVASERVVGTNCSWYYLERKRKMVIFLMKRRSPRWNKMEDFLRYVDCRLFLVIRWLPCTTIKRRGQTNCPSSEVTSSPFSTRTTTTGGWGSCQMEVKDFSQPTTSPLVRLKYSLSCCLVFSHNSVWKWPPPPPLAYLNRFYVLCRNSRGTTRFRGRQVWRWNCSRVLSGASFWRRRGRVQVKGEALLWNFGCWKRVICVNMKETTTLVTLSWSWPMLEKMKENTSELTTPWFSPLCFRQLLQLWWRSPEIWSSSPRQKTTQTCSHPREARKRQILTFSETSCTDCMVLGTLLIWALVCLPTRGWIVSFLGRARL